MANELRKHENIFAHIPLLNVVVTGGVDVYQDTSQPVGPGGPALSAVCSMQVGPLAVPPQTINPLANGASLDVPLASVPVSLPFVRSIPIDISATVTDYAWHPLSSDPNSGVVTFNLRLRATAMEIAGFQIALIPSVISLVPDASNTQQVLGEMARSISAQPVAVP